MQREANNPPKAKDLEQVGGGKQHKENQGLYTHGGVGRNAKKSQGL